MRPILTTSENGFRAGHPMTGHARWLLTISLGEPCKKTKP
jgi:hypothetical protein